MLIICWGAWAAGVRVSAAPRPTHLLCRISLAMLCTRGTVGISHPPVGDEGEWCAICVFAWDSCVLIVPVVSPLSLSLRFSISLLLFLPFQGMPTDHMMKGIKAEKVCVRWPLPFLPSLVVTFSSSLFFFLPSLPSLLLCMCAVLCDYIFVYYASI